MYFDLESISQGSIMARDSEWHKMIDLKESTEQFTGLRDKNGKEVYEGDIVSRNVPWARAGAIQFAQGIFGINWDYGQNTDPLWLEGTMYGSWCGKHNLRPIDDNFMTENMEVIGNIHENQELLS
jgi:uncharacterized phage protein (TIGR01671 family)